MTLPDKAERRGPSVSVVVATRNRPARLRALLASLRRQSLPKTEFEVVVVDDCSEDPATADALERELADGGLNLRVIRRQNAEGPAAARNDGWRVARAPIVAFTDDDCVADAEWLSEGLRACQEQSDGIVQGRTEPDPDEVHLLTPFSRTLTVRDLGPFYQTSNIFYPRSLLERLGGFDSAAYSMPGGEDTDLAWRAIETGAPTSFADGAMVFHAVNQLGPVGKLRFALHWGETMQVFKRHPELRRAVFVHGLFWKYSHYLLVRALIGLALPRSLWLIRLRLVWRYAQHVFRRGRGEGRYEGNSPLLAPYYVLYDLVELAAIIRAAIRYRMLVL
jgi:glycosyltransferase involved in cell wall biosynthesis